MSSRLFTGVRYVRHISQINDFPVTMSKDKLSAIYASNSTVQATCTKKFPPEQCSSDICPRYMSIEFFLEKLVQATFVQEICPDCHAQVKCPKLKCSWHMPTRSCAVHYAHHQWRWGMWILYTSAVWPHAAGMCRVHSLWAWCSLTWPPGYTPRAQSNRHNRRTLS